MSGEMRVISSIDGLDSLIAKLKRIDNNVGQARKVALVAGALKFQNKWKENVGVVTGTYRRSIQHEVEEESTTTTTVVVGTNIVDPPYPFYTEYGTSKISPRGWARSAWDSTIKDVIQTVSEKLKEAILKATQ